MVQFRSNRLPRPNDKLLQVYISPDGDLREPRATYTPSHRREKNEIKKRREKKEKRKKK